MGVDVSPVNMVGILFDSTEDGKDFIREWYTELEEFDVDDYEDITGGLMWNMISGYSDSGGVIGVEIGTEDLDPQGIGVQNAWKKAFALFPKEVHDRIKPHCWAQYW